MWFMEYESLSVTIVGVNGQFDTRARTTIVLCYVDAIKPANVWTNVMAIAEEVDTSIFIRI